MTIEETRVQAVNKLAELSKIKSPRYSAKDLHSKRQMLGRVQRQERRRYIGKVTAQKVKLTKDIADIDRYLQSVEDYNVYIASIPPTPIHRKGFSIQSVSLVTPVAPVVLPTPTVVIGKKPVLRRTRLPRDRSRRRY